MGLPTRSKVTRPLALGYGAIIDDLYLRLAIAPGRQANIQTAPDSGQQLPNTESVPEEFRTEPGDIYARSAFSGGEGLDAAHRPDATEDDWKRYWDSYNIDITVPRPGEQDKLQLLHTITEIGSYSSSTPYMTRVGATLFFANGSDVVKITNITSSPPTFTAEDPEAGGTPTTVAGLCRLGGNLYAALGAEGIHTRSTGGTWSHYSTLTGPTNATGCWAAKSRVIAAGSEELFEVVADGDGDDILLYTLEDGSSWVGVADGGAAILAAADNGWIYAFAEENGELVLKGQTRIEGEEPTSIAVAQGIILVGTREETQAGGYVGRLWVAELVGLRLTDAQMIREWGNESSTLDHSPMVLVGTRDSLFIGVREDSTNTHLWRYLLATGGLVRHLPIAAGGTVYGIVEAADRLFVGVGGQGVFREDTTFASSGWLIGPRADFFLAADKHWVGARLNTDTLATGETATLSYSNTLAAQDDDSHSSWTAVVELIAGDTGGDEEAMEGVTGRWIIPKVTLTGGGSTTPEVYSFAFRGRTKTEDVVMEVPINVSDWVEAPNRRAVKVPGRGDTIWQELKSKEGTNVLFELLRPSDKIRGTLELVSTPIMSITERGSPTMFSMIRVRGKRVA